MARSSSVDWFLRCVDSEDDTFWREGFWGIETSADDKDSYAAIDKWLEGADWKRLTVV